MMANCDMAPTIVVSTSYDYGDPVESYPDEDPYCKALPQELVNDLIPLVESRYHTYTKAADLATIESSREHRAIGAFDGCRINMVCNGTISRLFQVLHADQF